MMKTRLLSRFARRFARDESGATAIEYGLIASVITIALMGAASAVSGNLGAQLNSLSTAIK